MAEDGGGIYVGGSSTATLTNSRVDGNTATDGGGLNVAGDATLNSSRVDGNTGDYLGGGLYVNGSVVIIESRIEDNTAVPGGGLYLYQFG
jgi:hypothetical protein